VAAAAGSTRPLRVYNYTGDPTADAATTAARRRAKLCLKCIPGLGPPAPYGACPLHSEDRGLPAARPYPSA